MDTFWTVVRFHCKQCVLMHLKISIMILFDCIRTIVICSLLVMSVHRSDYNLNRKVRKYNIKLVLVYKEENTRFLFSSMGFNPKGTVDKYFTWYRHFLVYGVLCNQCYRLLAVLSPILGTSFGLLGFSWVPFSARWNANHAMDRLMGINVGFEYGFIFVFKFESRCWI